MARGHLAYVKPQNAWRPCMVGVCCLLLCGLWPLQEAAAQALSARQLNAAETVLQLDREALDLFGQLEFELARRSLIKALDAANGAKLTAHPLAARCKLHLALVYLVGFDDEPQALLHLQQALAIDPELKLPDDQRRPEMLALLEKAKAGSLSDANFVESEEEALEADEPAPMAPTAAKPKRVAVALRSPARADLSQERDEENPLQDADTQGEGVGPNLAGRWWLGLAIGTGMGYAGGEGLEAYKEYGGAFSPGVTTSGGGHAAPELGWHLSRHWALAVQTRHQYLPGGDQRTARGANAALFKAMLFGNGRLVRPTLAVGAGGGEGFRLPVQVRADGRVLHDTVRGGPGVGLLSVGAGFALSRSIWGTVEASSLVGFPIFSMAFDLNVGVRFYL
jgi:hypothetical protein